MPVLEDVFRHWTEDGLERFTAKIGGRIVTCFGPLCSGCWAYRVFKPAKNEAEYEGRNQTLEEAAVTAIGFALSQPFQTLEGALHEARGSQVLEWYVG